MGKSKRMNATTKSPKKDKVLKIKKKPNPAIPARRGKPFTRSPQHGKWPAMFKRHLGVIEAHIKTLDRVLQSTKAQMQEMDEEQRKKWELGEQGNWKTICGMMDRTREILASARECSKGILPVHLLRDKKASLGVADSEFTPLGPKLEDGGNVNGSVADADIYPNSDTDDADESANDGDDAQAESVPPNIAQRAPKLPGKSSVDSDGDTDMAEFVEPNPYFVVDINPTPVNLGGGDSLEKGKEGKKGKKRSKDNGSEEKKVKRSKTKEKHDVSELQPEKVDFTAVEAKLQAEVEAGLRAKQQQEKAQAAEAVLEKKAEKRKRRESGADSEKEAKKAKKEKRKRKAEDVGDVELDEVEKKKKKKTKEEKNLGQ